MTSLSDANESRASAESDLERVTETLRALEERLAEMDANDGERASKLAVSSPLSCITTPPRLRFFLPLRSSGLVV